MKGYRLRRTIMRAKTERFDGISVAEKMGQPVETVYKTLVTMSPQKEYYVFVIPVAEELDLKAAARASAQSLLR